MGRYILSFMMAIKLINNLNNGPYIQHSYAVSYIPKNEFKIKINFFVMFKISDMFKLKIFIHSHVKKSNLSKNMRQ